MNSKTTGLVIIGFGGMGSQHAEMLKPVESIRVIGSFDIDRESQDYSQSLGYKAYPSLDAVLADKDAEIVLIATPNDSHRDIAIKALRAGKHVICEKPVALNSRQILDIMDAVRETGNKFMVHQNRRWDEDYLVMKKLYNEGTLGRVFHIECRVHGSRGIPGDWRRLPENGGGMMLDWGVHLLDRLLIMIPEKVTQVFCKLHYQTNKPSDEGFHLFLTFESGLTALIEVNTCNYITLPKWYMLGTIGTAVVADWEMNGKVVKSKDMDNQDAKPVVAGAGFTKTMATRLHDSLIEEPLPRINADVRDFYRNFLDVIAGKSEPAIKNTEVLRVMKLLEAGFESHRESRVVYFE